MRDTAHRPHTTSQIMCYSPCHTAELGSLFSNVFDICRHPCRLAIWAHPVSTCHFDRLCDVNVPRPTARAILIFANQSSQSPSFAPPAASFAQTCCPSIYRSAAHCRPHTASSDFYLCPILLPRAPLSVSAPAPPFQRGGFFNELLFPLFTCTLPVHGVLGGTVPASLAVSDLAHWQSLARQGPTCGKPPVASILNLPQKVAVVAGAMHCSPQRTVLCPLIV